MKWTNLMLHVFDVLAAMMLTTIAVALVLVLRADWAGGFHSGHWLAVAVLFALGYAVIALAAREHPAEKESR